MTLRLSRSMLITTVLLGVVVGEGCSGGGAEGGCGSTASCGGDPTGQWAVDGVCQYMPPQPAQPLSFPDYTAQPQDPTIPPPQPQPTTSGSWCSGLVYSPPSMDSPDGTVMNVTLWHEPAVFTSGTMNFTPDHQYQASLVLSTQSSTYFPVSCLQANGFQPKCSVLQTELNKFYVSAAMQRHADPAYRAPRTADPASGIKCQEMTDGGCICDYTYQVTVLDKGAWASNGSLLSLTNELYTYNGVRNAANAPTLPNLANYCASGDQLTMSGNAGTSLSGVVGLRTMSLRKM
jgi:hypothetical protein